MTRPTSTAPNFFEVALHEPHLALSLAYPDLMTKRDIFQLKNGPAFEQE
jgi:hypothetical protein